MKLGSFSYNDRNSFGVVTPEGIVDLRQAFGDRYLTLKDFLAHGSIGSIKDLLRKPQPHIATEAVTWLPVIPNPGKIWCCGLNYHAHVEECGTAPSSKPTFFLRFADSQVGHGQPIMLPRESSQLDYEGEIAVIIGRGGRRIRPEDAAQHVAGYTCYNDASVRDWQLATPQWDAGKNFWRTGAFGPWMVTPEEIAFGQELDIVTRLNGIEVQRATTKMLIHDIASQIAYVSTIAPLEAGDVIVTGTPGGIGAMRQPPLWLGEGDSIEVSVGAIGTLVNTVARD